MKTSEYSIKVKNVLGKNKKITLLDGTEYILKDKDEKVIGEYTDESKPIVFNLLKTGFEVSKILTKNIKPYMIIDTELDTSKTVLDDKKNITNKNILNNEEKPKKKRGRPPKNK